MISIDTVFKVVNFIATLFLFKFMLQQYIIPFFDREKKKFDSNLKDRKSSCILLQKQFDQLIIGHEQLVVEGKALEEKCKQWAQQIKKDYNQKEEQLQLVHLKMLARRQKQWIYIQKQRCLQQKLPIIFHDVEQYFSSLPNKEKVSEKYCDTLLTFMKD